MPASATKSLAGPAPGSSTPAPSPQAARATTSTSASSQAGAPFLRLSPLRTASAGNATGKVRELLGRESGQPLALPVKSTLERSLGVDLSPVRVHQGPGAETLVREQGARAFTVGSHVMLGAGERADDLALIAHEVAHVVQQQGGATTQRYSGAIASDNFEREAHDVSAAVVSGRPTVVRERTSPRPQFLFGWARRGLAAVGGAIRDAASAVADVVGDVIGLALDFIRDHARLIPGYDLLAFIIGRDPITQANVDRSPVNLIKGLMGLWPGGSLIFDALQAHGIIAKVGAWLSVKLDTLVSIVSSIGSALDRFLHTLGPGDLLDLGGAYNRAKAIFTVPIGRALDFIGGLAGEVLGFIRDAILLPVARLAEGTAGYPLLKAVLGKDPITGEPVPQDPATLIGGFMKLIHEDEIWENMQKARAIPRAFAWFRRAMSELMGFVRAIPETFVNALKSLDVADMILIPRAFAKLGKAFGTFALKFISWAGGTIWNLLEIIFDVVSPGALSYIKRTGSAIRSIFRNPIPFVGNLVKAAKLGFTNFADHFGTHLKNGLIDWLTGSLPGVYIPQAFTLGEIVKFVFSVLGLSWANIRSKLVNVVGEPAVKLMETTFDIVVTLVRDGPAAAWERIKAEIDALKDQVINGIIGMVVEAIATKAVPKLIAMFIPGAGFISAIISIYDVVMVFVEKISKIIQVVKAFVDSIVNIAAGQIGGAAQKVESSLANLLSLAISFLAGFAGLGKIADKIMGVIQKVRGIVDKGLDALIKWIVTMAKKIGKFAVEKAGEIVDWWKEKLGFTNAAGESHTLQFIGTDDAATLGIQTTLMPVRKYLDEYEDKGSEWTKANDAFLAATELVFNYKKKDAQAKRDRAAIKAALKKLSAAFAALGGAPPKTDADYDPKPDPIYDPPARVEAIVGKPKEGSRTGPWPKDEKGYKEIYDAHLTTATDPWVQMHIISEKLGGSGKEPKNLVPAPGSVNTGPFRSFEHSTAALAAAKSGPVKNRVWVEVHITGPNHAATAISGKAGLYFWKGKKDPTKKWLKNETPSISASAGIPKPQFGARKLLLNFTSSTEMTRDFGVDGKVATLIKQGRPYRTPEEFVQSMLARGASPTQVTAIMAKGAVLNGP